MRNTKLILGLAVMSVASVANAATWTATANGSWGLGSNWLGGSVPASGDEIILDTSYQSATRTITLDGNRSISRLELTNQGTAVPRQFTLNPGSPAGSTLTITSGEIHFDMSGPHNGNSTLNLGNTRVQIGDGVTPVAAAWKFNVDNWVSGNKATASLTLGELIGIAGTTATISGSNHASGGSNGGTTLTLSKTSDNWHGQIIAGAGPAVVIVSQASNSLGSSQALLDFQAASSGPILRFSETTTQDASINLSSSGASYIVPTSADGMVTFNGDLTGTGNVNFNRNGGATTAFPTSTVVINGANNTLSGTLTLYMGTLRIDGTWTGAGNVTFNHPTASAATRSYTLDGTGDLSLAADNSVTLLGSVNGASGSSFVNVAPGTDGTIGTLSLGTSGTGKIDFDQYSVLKIDLDGLLSDRLTITGDLNINENSNTRLDFNELSAPTADQYVIASWTGTRTGTFLNVVGLPDGYELQYTGNQLLLVNPIPEPATLGTLALLGGMLVRRRRSH